MVLHENNFGSASKRRQEILKEMGYEFETFVADIDEKAIRHEDPGQMVLAIANAKADVLVPNLPREGYLLL